MVGLPRALVNEGYQLNHGDLRWRLGLRWQRVEGGEAGGRERWQVIETEVRTARIYCCIDGRRDREDNGALGDQKESKTHNIMIGKLALTLDRRP